MSLSVNIAARDLSKLATYVHSGVLELSIRSTILHRSKWHQKYVVICKDNTSTLNLFIYENHLAEKAEAVYLVKELESLQKFTPDDNNIIGFTIKFENPQIKPLVFSCDTKKSQEEWTEHINDSIEEAKHTSTDSAYASGGSVYRDSCRTSKPYFTIDDSDVIAEDIPTNIPKEISKDINNDNETSRKITETSSTTTVNQKDVSTNEKAHNVLHEDIPKGTHSEEVTCRKITTANQTDASKETKVTRTGKKHGRNDAVKHHVVDKDETNVKAMTSIPVQESKAGKASPGPSGKSSVKEITHGLTTNPVQASYDEDQENPVYENLSNGFSLTFESDIPQSAMLSVRQPHTSQMGAEDLESQTCSSSFVSARVGRDKMSFQTDSQQTTFVNTEPVYSRPHKKSSKSGETGAINNRNLPSSASSKSFSSVGSDASFKYESPEDTDQDERENIFKREDYFCPDRKQAIRQIEKSSIGTFLVCLNKDKCEVICFMTNLGPKVFKVHRREDGYSLFEPKMGMVFPTLDKLLAHYHINDLPSREYKVKLERVYQSK